jgi:hypothetical protein
MFKLTIQETVYKLVRRAIPKGTQTVEKPMESV